jgi:hypothetical protein
MYVVVPVELAITAVISSVVYPVVSNQPDSSGEAAVVSGTVFSQTL